MTDPADFTVDQFLAWARTKPADEAYDFIKAGVCALGQFAREVRGFSKEDAACGMYNHLLAPGLLDAANALAADCTFGALVTRLELLVHETPLPVSEWTTPAAYLTNMVEA